jgi:chaperonin GroES
MFQKFRPLGDRVLLKLVEEQEMTQGGLFIPPSASKEKAQTAQVIEVGPGRLDTTGKLVPLQVKVGDMVYFGKYSGTEAGKNHLIVREDEILGIIEK